MDDKLAVLEGRVETIARSNLQHDYALDRILREWIPNVNSCLQDIVERLRVLEGRPAYIPMPNTDPTPNNKDSEEPVRKSKKRSRKFSRSPRSIADYAKVMQLYKEGLSMNKIHKLLSIPYSTVYSYTMMNETELDLLRERERLEKYYEEQIKSPEFNKES
ncbi:MAG: hypothetical protein LBE38_08035 [Deltaproteobacteria bacterium]|jgi:transposase-like protein|nr:hypothetical protein [Deltaproteobacteria bacterium]